MPFYCHRCERTVSVDQSLRCERCLDDFIEEVSNAPEEQLNDSIDPHEFIAFIRNTVLAQQTPPETPPQSSSNNPTRGVPPGRATGGGPSARATGGAGGGILGSLLQQLFPGNNPVPSSSSRATPSSRGDSQPSDAPNPTSDQPSPPQQQDPQFQQTEPFMDFLNQLMANLSASAAPGTRFHIQFNGPPTVHGNVNNYIFGEAAFDQFISSLLNSVDQQPQGISEEDLQRLPETNVTLKHVDNGVQCTTCMETFELDERVAELECSHIFHKDCIIPWLKKQRTCPICRKEIDVNKWSVDPNAPPKKPTTITDIDELD